jgi:hypothetical protein
MAAGMLGLTAIAAALAGWAPIGFSIVTVFLFAGPHNWLEARYFLTRLPARWGKLWPFFTLGFGGVGLLTVAFAAIPWLSALAENDAGIVHGLVAGWLTVLAVWVAGLALMRSRQNPRRDWGWVPALGFGVIAMAWAAPWHVALAIVYLHPLMALWLLDRELKRTRPTWRPAYHLCLASIPAILGLLWWRLRSAPPLPGDSELMQAITGHAGAEILIGVSSHFLVAAHTFLEMVHYGVWVVAIPVIGVRIAPWQLTNVPLARRSGAWRRGVVIALLAGVGVMLALWAAFLADYPTTRHIYFTVAMLHVLAEVPFLLRAL